MQYDFYISYSKKNYELAKAVVDKLKSLGYKVFFDDIANSGMASVNIASGIKNCNAFVFLRLIQLFHLSKREN